MLGCDFGMVLLHQVGYLVGLVLGFSLAVHDEVAGEEFEKVVLGIDIRVRWSKQGLFGGLPPALVPKGVHHPVDGNRAALLARGVLEDLVAERASPVFDFGRVAEGARVDAALLPDVIVERRVAQEPEAEVLPGERVFRAGQLRLLDGG